MVMLSLFVRCGYAVGVAHATSSCAAPKATRTRCSSREEAARYGVPFYNQRFETAAEMERTGESMEMAARRLRYAWFDELSREGDTPP